MIGKTLAQYEITGLLGKGGMGEVYRGRDSKLGREVALKIPSADVAHDESRRLRLEQEARAVTSLQPPNIVPLFAANPVRDPLRSLPEYEALMRRRARSQ